MKKIFIALLKPKGLFSKLIISLFLIALITLGFLGHLDKLISFLDSDALTLKISKSSSLSAYKIIKSIFIIVTMFWVTSIISDYADMSFRKITSLKSANRAIINKAFQILLYFIAFLMLMDFLDIDLKSLAIFSGAVGIGVGFGLQKISSNFISGLILLFEKSARIDDLIELEGGVSGYVRYTGARYTLVESFDGREIMVPNETLITSKVTNWTYNNNKARVEIPIGVSYNCDIEKAKKLILEAAKENHKCLAYPEPKCFLHNFGAISVDFKLFFWVADIIDGRFGPQSEVMMAIWNKFKENNIQIPFQPHDTNIKNLPDPNKGDI